MSLVESRLKIDEQSGWIPSIFGFNELTSTIVFTLRQPLNATTPVQFAPVIPLQVGSRPDPVLYTADSMESLRLEVSTMNKSRPIRVMEE